MEHLERFDQIVVDSEISAAIQQEPAISTTQISHPPLLKYNAKQSYSLDFAQEVLYSANIDENRKLEFIHAALADENSRFSRYLSRFCPCASEQPKLAKVLEEHFRKISANADPEDPYKSYAHFEFIVQNDLPGSNELIDNYLANRPEKHLRYTEEALLAHLLIQRGRIDDALSIIKILIQEIENKESSSISDISSISGESLFVSLYYKIDNARREEVVKLIYHYCDIVKTGFWSGDLGRLRQDVLTLGSPQKPKGPSPQQLLATFQSYGYLAGRTLSEHDEFVRKYSTANKLIDETGSTYKSFGDLCHYPVRYDEFYYHHIHPLLIKNGVNAPYLEQQDEDKKLGLIEEADQVAEKIKQLYDADGDQTEAINSLRQRQAELQKAIGVYKLAITSDTTTRYLYIESEADGYELRPLCVALNLALADNQNTMRIVQLMDGDPISWFGVFNPDELIPLLLDVDVYGYAETFDDGLMPLTEQFRSPH